jgi:hypothetical protein
MSFRNDTSKSRVREDASGGGQNPRQLKVCVTRSLPACSFEGPYLYNCLFSCLPQFQHLLPTALTFKSECAVGARRLQRKHPRSLISPATRFPIQAAKGWSSASVQIHRQIALAKDQNWIRKQGSECEVLWPDQPRKLVPSFVVGLSTSIFSEVTT